MLGDSKTVKGSRYMALLSNFSDDIILRRLPEIFLRPTLIFFKQFLYPQKMQWWAIHFDYSPFIRWNYINHLDRSFELFQDFICASRGDWKTSSWLANRPGLMASVNSSWVAWMSTIDDRTIRFKTTMIQYLLCWYILLAL